MKRRFDVTTPRPKHDGSGVWWMKLGSAVENDKGQITVFLEALPLISAETGKAQLNLFEPRDQYGAQPDPPTQTKGKNKPKTKKEGEEESADEIPF